LTGITVTADGRTVSFELADTSAARSLLAQLPLDAAVEDYSDNEKVLHPASPLDVSKTPLLESAQAGTLACFEPWDNNVVLHYGEAGAYPGLYALGRATSGVESIACLSGVLHVEAA
jgi:hypothetical protein